MIPILELKKINIVLDCADAGQLGEFYSRLLGWPVSHPHQNGWCAVTSPQGMIMAFQEVSGYTPPVWPWEADKQGQMLHLDFVVEDLSAAVSHAISCGAVLAGEQFFASSRTMLDPAGHPFCIDTE